MSEQQELFCYKQMPVWTADEIPEALLSKHNTAAGNLGLPSMSVQGRLNFNEVDEAGNITATHELTPESGDWIIPSASMALYRAANARHGNPNCRFTARRRTISIRNTV